ncbi:FGGY-family carbohydrate kinase [Halobellus rarus]|uniref:FGGY-family carbohydrate kinase n=1 Tax=Halobellus rarus TaxID=1126237 RepID=A0ABD6CQ96_9EURY|nr:FGGY-family carbohydrate kinase [Halobellus rarus]
MDECLLGFDIGTTNSKGLLIDPDLNVIESASLPHGVSTPEPGWVEHEPSEIWWGEFTELIRELLAVSEIDPERIAGIGISGLAPSVLPLDESGAPLRPGMLYGVDTRAGEEIKLLNEWIGEERILEVCGNSLSFQSAGPKILWLKRNEPEIFERTETIVDAVGYVVSQLTDEYVMDNAVASFFHPLYNLKELEWDAEMFERAGLDPELLPETKWSAEVAGEVTPDAAERTGLAVGTPVVTGAVDAIAALLSVGGVEPGDTVFMYGTTGVVYSTCAEPRTVPGVWSTPHSVEGKYAVGGGMATSGAITEWFADQFAGEAVLDEGVGKGKYDHLSEEAAEIDPGSEGLVVLPYFSGSRTPLNDDRARGTIAGLTLSHTKYHVYRAILEGVGYGFRHNLEMIEHADVPIGRTFAIGGGAQSDLWRQIVSDITGYEQKYVSDPLGAPLGSAYLAGIGSGVFDGYDALKTSTTAATTTPANPARTAIYDEYYDVYRDLYPAMKDEMHRLASLGNK